MSPSQLPHSGAGRVSGSQLRGAACSPGEASLLVRFLLTLLPLPGHISRCARCLPSRAASSSSPPASAAQRASASLAHRPPGLPAGCGDPIPLLPDRAAPRGAEAGPRLPYAHLAPQPPDRPHGHRALGQRHPASGRARSTKGPFTHRCSQTPAPFHRQSAQDVLGKGYLCFWQMKGVLFWRDRRGGPRKVNPLFLVPWTRKMGLACQRIPEGRQEPLGIVSEAGGVSWAP